MPKSAILFGVICLVSLTQATAQHAVNGRVVDDQQQPLDYATVALLHPVDSTLQYFGVTNKEGKYQIKISKQGITYCNALL